MKNNSKANVMIVAVLVAASEMIEGLFSSGDHHGLMVITDLIGKKINQLVGNKNDDASRSIYSSIEYTNEDGDIIESSLINDHFMNTDADDRELLHKSLDEWFDNSRGTGRFIVADRDFC